jgi:hypothetical protein
MIQLNFGPKAAGKEVFSTLMCRLIILKVLREAS